MESPQKERADVGQHRPSMKLCGQQGMKGSSNMFDNHPLNSISQIQTETTPHFINLTKPAAKLTTFTTQKGRLVKSFMLNNEGKLVKSPPGILKYGTYKTSEVSLEELRKGLSRLTGRQCIALGTADTSQGEIGYKSNAIRRTKEHFKFRNQPTLCLLDIDGVKLKTDAVLEILAGIIPGFKHTGKLIVHSSSAGLYAGDRLLKDSSSFHIYFIVKNGTDIPRFMQVLFDRLWLEGHGWFIISKAPALLRRGLIDASVGSPERLIYEGSPLLGKGIKQRRSKPELIPGGMLDTFLLPDLSKDEQKKLQALIEQKRQEIQPELDKAVSLKADRLSKEQNISRQQALHIVSQHQEGILDDELTLYFKEHGGIKVKNALVTGKALDGASLADPLEPEYDGGSKTKAIFFWNNGKYPFVYSHAHGGIKYRFASMMPEQKGLRAFSVTELVKMELPPRKNLMNPWLPEQGLCMIHAPRGIGKTFLSLNIAYAIAAGIPFLRWEVPEPKGVLYLDGEMPASTIQERLGIIMKHGKPLQAPFQIVNPDLQPDREPMPNLATKEGQEAIDRLVTDEIKLIVVDNLSCLAHGGKENDAESWSLLQTWGLKHRAQGRSVLFIHHSGKTGLQRGTSRREDVLDTVIKLQLPVDTSKNTGARFQIIFEKNRQFYGDDAEPFEVALVDGEWLMSSVEGSTYRQVVKLKKEGLRPPEIAKELNIHRSSVSRHIQKAKDRGDLPA